MIRSSLIKELDENSANAIRAKRMATRGFKPRNSPVQNNTFAKIEAQTGAKASQVLTFPEDLGSTDQGHFIMFFINEQKNANVKFGSSGEKFFKTEVSGEGKDRKVTKVGIPVDNGSVSDSQQNAINQQKGKSTVSVKRAPTKRLTRSICMYMPAQLSQSQDMQYEEAEIGALARMIEGFGSSFQKTGSFEATFERERGAITEQTEQLLKQTLDTVAPGAKAAAEITAGKVFSNRLETVFKGLGKREFQFQFTMMPKSENEANIAKNIVETFRFFSAPSFEGPPDSSRVFVVPATFDIEYRLNSGIQNSYMNRISTCVLKNLSVTYGGEKVAFFRPNADGAPPVQTSISLTFQELELITRERIAAGF